MKTVLGVLCKRLPKVPGQPPADPHEEEPPLVVDTGVADGLTDGTVAVGEDRTPGPVAGPPPTTTTADDVGGGVGARVPPIRHKPAKAKAAKPKAKVPQVDATAEIADDVPPAPAVLDGPDPTLSPF